MRYKKGEFVEHFFLQENVNPYWIGRIILPLMFLSSSPQSVPDLFQITHHGALHAKMSSIYILVKSTLQQNEEVFGSCWFQSPRYTQQHARQTLVE